MDDFKKMLFDSMARGHAKAEETAKKTGEDINDMLFTMPAAGKEPEAMSIKDFNERGISMPFICGRACHGPSDVPGSTKETCDGCREQVWMSQETKKVFLQIAKRLIVCDQCISTMADRFEKSSLVATRGAAQAAKILLED